MIDAKTRAKYQADIGIETHVQLKTKSKLFCACARDAREAAPNTNVCPVCLGLPGALPVLNRGAVELAARAGAALNGQVADFTKFDRKNYFYPDLPKGYQITQYDQPIISSGYVDVATAATREGKTFPVNIERAHLEEDAGKTVHPAGADYSLVDFNRAGAPLLEIVSAPDIHTPAEARAYATELYHIMRYGQISDVDLSRGNMRFDVNISVRPAGATELGVRAEIKNINSFRFVEKVVEFEIKRQIELLEKGQGILQETRGWDEARGKTVSQRTKEEAHDYRYFPEPDLPPLELPASLAEKASANLVRPSAIREEFDSIGIAREQTELLLSDPAYIESVRLVADAGGREAAEFHAKLLANVWLGVADETARLTITPAQAVDLHKLSQAGQLSSTNAKKLFVDIQGLPDKDVREFAAQQSLLQISGTDELEAMVKQVMDEHQSAVKDYQAGNANSLQFLVGQVMKQSGGAANPELVRDLLKKKLS